MNRPVDARPAVPLDARGVILGTRNDVIEGHRRRVQAAERTDAVSAIWHGGVDLLLRHGNPVNHEADLKDEGFTRRNYQTAAVPTEQDDILLRLEGRHFRFAEGSTRPDRGIVRINTIIVPTAENGLTDEAAKEIPIYAFRGSINQSYDNIFPVDPESSQNNQLNLDDVNNARGIFDSMVEYFEGGTLNSSN